MDQEVIMVNLLLTILCGNSIVDMLFKIKYFFYYATGTEPGILA